METLVKIEKLTVAYDSKIVIENVCLSLYEEDFIGIIGPNGGGKTTLLKAILGLINPLSGSIIFSEKLKNKGLDIGYLPQVNNFDKRFPINVFDVVLSGISCQDGWYKKNSKKDKEKCELILSQLGIQDISRKLIGELSGGQMQRAFLGRALISDPKLLILDEPGTYVDNQFENELYKKLKELNKQMAIMLVTHDIGSISSYVKTIACVNKNLYYHPSNIITQDQLTSYNCPIKLITHGNIPHTVLESHDHTSNNNN